MTPAQVKDLTAALGALTDQLRIANLISLASMVPSDDDRTEALRNTGIAALAERSQPITTWRMRRWAAAALAPSTTPAESDPTNPKEQP